MPRKTRAPKPQQLTTLAELLRLKAAHSYIKLSSFDLGKRLDISQQAASKRLADLERDGFIERLHSGRGFSVRLTDSGLHEVRSFYGELRSAFEDQKKDLTFTGTVFNGLREGGYYVSMKGYSSHFQSMLGFRPFPGTLNLRLSSPVQIEQRRQLESLQGVEIPGFEDKDRTYGPVKCFRAEIEGRIPGAVLAIERTHYDSSVLEVISPLDLRKTLKLDEGDECEVTAYLE
ncbi:MAG: CTP-dependent riboflavin kinase [Thaumarchaeota archaeon]|nr:CTP-dependent riboflavin kinase [Nitrososphaerota archaeon]